MGYRDYDFQIAAAEKVPLVDMAAVQADKFEMLGPDTTRLLFPDRPHAYQRGGRGDECGVGGDGVEKCELAAGAVSGSGEGANLPSSYGSHSSNSSNGSQQLLIDVQLEIAMTNFRSLPRVIPAALLVCCATLLAQAPAADTAAVPPPPPQVNVPQRVPLNPNLPTIFVVGDSTASNGREPGLGIAPGGLLRPDQGQCGEPGDRGAQQPQLYGRGPLGQHAGGDQSRRLRAAAVGAERRRRSGRRREAGMRAAI